MERIKNLTPFRKGLLILLAGMAAVFTVIYLFTGRLTAAGENPLYVLGTGAALLGAICIVFAKEVFEKKKKRDDEGFLKPSTPGVGAKFAPTLTQLFFTVTSLACYVAGLMS